MAYNVPPVLAEYQRILSPLAPGDPVRFTVPEPHIALFVPLAEAGMGFIVAVTAVLALVLSHPVELL